MQPSALFRRPAQSALRPVALVCSCLMGAAVWVGQVQAAEPLFAPVPPTPPVVLQPAPVQAPGALSEQARQRLSEQAPSSRVKAISGRVSNEPAPANKSPVAQPVTSTARQVAPNHLEPLWGNDAVPAGPIPGNKPLAARKAEQPAAAKVTPVADAQPAKPNKAVTPSAAVKRTVVASDRHAERHSERHAAKAERQPLKAAKATQSGKASGKVHAHDKVGTTQRLAAHEVPRSSRVKGVVSKGKPVARGSQARASTRVAVAPEARRTKHAAAVADARAAGKAGRAKPGAVSKPKVVAKSTASSRKDRAVAHPVSAKASAKVTGKATAKTATAHAHADKAKSSRAKPKAAPHVPHAPTKRAA